MAIKTSDPLTGSGQAEADGTPLGNRHAYRGFSARATGAAGDADAKLIIRNGTDATGDPLDYVTLSQPAESARECYPEDVEGPSLDADGIYIDVDPAGGAFELVIRYTG